MAHVVLAHFFCVESFGRPLVKPFALCYRTLSLQKGDTDPDFSPMFVAAKRLDGSKCHMVRWQASTGQHCVRCGYSCTPKGQSPQISAHVCPVCLQTLVYCGQTVRRIKMKLGVQVGLGHGHTVLDGNSGPLPKGTQPPVFGPYLLWPNGSMDQDATW